MTFDSLTNGTGSPSKKMNRYRFKATDASGKRVSGVEKAPSMSAAHAALIGRGLHTLRVRAPHQLTKIEITKKKVPRRDVAAFSRQLAVFLKAGVPIMEALEVIARETQNKLLYRVLREAMLGLKSGKTLPQTLAEHPEAFPEFYIAVLSSAEYTGNLDVALLQLSTYIDREAKAKRKITSALTYPGIVAVMGIAAVVVLSKFVLPRFVPFFESFHATLPLPTRILMHVSAFMTSWGTQILAGILAAVIFVVLMRRTHAGASLFDRVILKIPVIGPITQCAILERTTRVLSALLRAGVDLSLAMTVTATSARNTVYQRAIGNVRAQVMEGLGLADPIERTGLFTGTAQQMFRVGEETGTLDAQLDIAADYYAEELEIKVERATGLFEPAMIVVVGLVVGVRCHRHRVGNVRDLQPGARRLMLRDRSTEEGGFTLVELLVVTVLIPIVVGALALAISAAFAVQSTVTNRVASAGDAQVTGSLFYEDVQGADIATTSATLTQCGTGTQMLGLEWSPEPTDPVTYNDVVSYVEEQTGSTKLLVRNFCGSGASASATTSTILASAGCWDIAALAISPNSEAMSASSSWVSTQAVTNIGLTIDCGGAGSTYALVASPAAGASGGTAR